MDYIINLLNFIFTGLHGYQTTPGLSTNQGERRGRGNELFLPCRNSDSLAVVVVVAYFDPYLAGLGRADDCFCLF